MPPRKTPLERTILQRTTVPKPRRSISPASTPQREKIADAACAVCGSPETTPAHLAARARGGCDHALCVIPLCGGPNGCHRALDEGRLDVLPSLLRHGHVAEIQHALGHYGGNLLYLLHRLTGTRWTPETPNERNE
jgi:hypothetical protein